METVTVRMARGERHIPWGFGVTEGPKGESIIVNVVGGSLADRAGLRNGDEIEQLEGLNNLDINAVDRLLVTSRERIELIVHRQSGATSQAHHLAHHHQEQQQARVWRPDVKESGDEQRPYHVSLEHSSDSRPPEGFNSSALPFQADPRVKHLQYNSPMGLYSNANVAESYNQQTAGYVDSQAAQHAQDQPSYLRSETLRLVKEQEAQRGPPTLSQHPNPAGLPLCFVCNRKILGVMARAAGHDLHADCFQCATCGNSLKNVGHHFVEHKFYCDIHGRQKKGLTSAGGPGIDPNLVVQTPPTAAHPVRVQENVQSFYQPNILTRRQPTTPIQTNSYTSNHQINVNLTNPKTQGPISPAQRGVPTNNIYAGDHGSSSNVSPRSSSFNYQHQNSSAQPQIQQQHQQHQHLENSRPQYGGNTGVTSTNYSYNSTSTATSGAVPAPPTQAPPPLPTNNQQGLEVNTCQPLQHPHHLEVIQSDAVYVSPRPHESRVPASVRSAVSPRPGRAPRNWPPAPSNPTLNRYWIIDPVGQANTEKNINNQPKSLQELIQQEEQAQPSRYVESYIVPSKEKPKQDNTNQIDAKEPKIHDGIHWTVISGPVKVLPDTIPPATPIPSPRLKSPAQDSMPPLLPQLKVSEVLSKDISEVVSSTTNSRTNILCNRSTANNLPVRSIGEIATDKNVIPKIEVSAQATHSSPIATSTPIISDAKNVAEHSMSSSSSLKVITRQDSSTSPIPVIRFERHSSIVKAKPSVPDSTSDASLKTEVHINTSEYSGCNYGNPTFVFNSSPRPFESGECRGSSGKKVDFLPSPITIESDNRWIESDHIVDESDILTDHSKRSDDSIDGSSVAPIEYGLTTSAGPYDGDISEQLCDDKTYLDEQDEWMREEVEQARLEQLELLSIKGVSKVATQSTDKRSIALKKQSSISKADQSSDEENWIQNPIPVKENEEEQRDNDLAIVAALHDRLHDIREMEEQDRLRAIECIERHQQSLEDQQDQLSYLLNSAIQYLKSFGSDDEQHAINLSRLMAPHSMSSHSPISDTMTPSLHIQSQYNEDFNDISVQNKAIAPPTPPPREEPKGPPTPPVRRHFLTSSTLPTHSSSGGVLDKDQSINVPSSVSPTFTHGISSQQDVTERLTAQLSRRQAQEEDQNYSQSSFSRTETFSNNASKPSAQISTNSANISQQQAGGRIPYCEACKQQIRGAFILASGLSWCPEHFVCANARCGRRLLECGFVEERGQKYCEGCFEAHIAPRCSKCTKPIISDCLNALQKKWHPTCFTCTHCQKPFGSSAFYLENGQAYCEADWNTLFTTKCVSCKFAIEAGDRWVEALGNAYHSNCFNCWRCHVNLEGESFFAKDGQPFCKLHA